MADNKQGNANIFFKAGQALGGSKAPSGGFNYSAGISQAFESAKLINQSIKKGVDKNKEKTDALLAQFPGGISVPKMDANLDGVVGNYLKEQRGIYGDLAAIVAKGPEENPDYDSAVGKMNQIEGNIKNVNANLENFASKRATLLDARKDGVEYAKSTSIYQDKNLYNLTSGDFESLNPQITIDDNGNATMTILDAQGNQVDIDEIDLPNEYNDVLEKGVDALVDGAQVLKEDGKIKGDWEGSIERRNSIRTIKDLSKNQKLIKDYMHQNPELIDQYIANDLGVDVDEVANDPDYEDILEFFTSDYTFDKDRFVNLVTQAVDDRYNNSTTYEKENVIQENYLQTKVIDPIIDDNASTTIFNNNEEEEEDAETEVEEKEPITIAEQMLNIKRPSLSGTNIYKKFNKKELREALASGDISNEVLEKYLVEIPGVSIENGVVKGLENVSAGDFNTTMRKLQQETKINLGYNI